MTFDAAIIMLMNSICMFSCLIFLSLHNTSNLHSVISPSLQGSSTATFPKFLQNSYYHSGDTPATFTNLPATKITWYNTDTNRTQFTAKVQRVTLLNSKFKSCAILVLLLFKIYWLLKLQGTTRILTRCSLQQKSRKSSCWAVSSKVVMSECYPIQS